LHRRKHLKTLKRDNYFALDLVKLQIDSSYRQKGKESLKYIGIYLKQFIILHWSTQFNYKLQLHHHN